MKLLSILGDKLVAALVPASAAIKKLQRNQGGGALIILAGLDPAADLPSDGFLTRVLAIDSILADKQRIYLHIDKRHQGAPVLRQNSSCCFTLTVGERYWDRAVVRSVVGQAGAIYAHSIYNLAVSPVWRALQSTRKHFILDMHGAVPEELQILGQNEAAQHFEKIESQASKQASAVVVVSDAMRLHWQEKHATAAVAILCPIFSGGSAVSLQMKSKSPLRVVYAGGTQVWQEPDMMAQLVRARRDDFDFVIMTPGVTEMLKILQRSGVEPVDSVRVFEAKPEQVHEELSAASMGFVLRKDNVVNRVACPTKIIEYITFGVVPIVDAIRIGDFASFGLRHVAADDFRRGFTPSSGDLAEMASENLNILDRLKEQSASGLAQIEQIISRQIAAGS